MAKPTESENIKDLSSLQEQVTALTAVLAERDKQCERLIETVAHLTARIYNVESLVDLRKNAGQGPQSLRMAPGLTIEGTYADIVERTRNAIVG